MTDSADSFTDSTSGQTTDDLDALLGGYEGVSVDSTPAAEVSAVDGAHDAVGDRNRHEPALDREVVPYEIEPHGSLAEPFPGAAAVAPGRSWLWLLWWLPSVLLPPFGGIAAWVALRSYRREEAAVMFWVSVALGLVGSLILMIYAEQIAGFVTGASRNTVIYVK